MMTRPARHAEPITPDDDADLGTTTQGLYVGGTGDVKVRMESGQDVTFSSVPAGEILPVSVTRVHATGTTAANIVALV